MLKRMTKWLGFGGKNTMQERTAHQIALLKSLRRDVIPDPAALGTELAADTREIESGDSEFDRLDHQGGSQSYLRLQPLAERLAALRTRAQTLPAQIAKAQAQEAAFLELVAAFDAIGDDVQVRVDAQLDHPPADEGERLRALRALDEAARLWVRLAWVLQTVSTDRRFKEPPDVLARLRLELESRAREIERLRTPGGKGRFVAPPHIAALINAVEGRILKEAVHGS